MQINLGLGITVYGPDLGKPKVKTELTGSFLCLAPLVEDLILKSETVRGKMFYNLLKFEKDFCRNQGVY